MILDGSVINVTRDGGFVKTMSEKIKINISKGAKRQDDSEVKEKTNPAAAVATVIISFCLTYFIVWLGIG